MQDEALWRDCRWEAFRGSGPGGQKRNKTSSAVRVTHEPTGLAVVASESRSQAQNRERAFQRLRRNLSFELRQPIASDDFVIPTWFLKLIGNNNRLRLSIRHELFLATGGLALDLIVATRGSVADAAKLLKITTGNLVTLLESDEVMWDQANRIRLANGLKPLKISAGG
jgi:hypothetical protein